MKDCDEGNESKAHDNYHSLHIHTGQRQSGATISAAGTIGSWSWLLKQ